MKMNKHLQNQLDSNYCALLPDDIRQSVFDDYETMSSLGIDNDEDQNKFFLIRNHVPEIVFSLFKTKLNDKTAKAVAAEVFRNRENQPIDTLLDLIEATDLALKKMMPPNIRPKLAYPQPDSIHQLPQYDVGRWVSATREIYGLMSKGFSSDQAKQSVIGSWESREKMDYEQWLKFYKERVPEKYPKLAFDASELLLGGIPANSLKAVLPTPNGQGYATKVSPGLPQELPHDTSDVRDKIETQRKKIISRLNSAEKMLASTEGQMFAGDDQELMLKLLQDLKRRIQIANKRTVRSSLFEDHIFRTANMLKAQGRDEAAGFFYKVAQLPPLGGPPAPPGGGLGGGLGDLGGGPDAGGDVPATGSGKGNKQETHDLLDEFFNGLKRGVNDKNDTPEEREELEKAENAPPAPAAPAPAAPPTPEGGGAAPAPEATIEAYLEMAQPIKLGNGIWQPTIKLGQVPPAPATAPRVPVPPASAPAARPAPEVEVESEPSLVDDNTDDVIEAALKNVTVQDVIHRLEMLVSIYNQREISRQMAVLDIMMDRLGLASFFPALGEAMQKALDANQYIGSRLEDILGKIKGSVDAPGANEWIEVVQEENPETENIRNRLEQNKAQEEKRKEMRKQKELAKLQGGQAGPDVGPAAEGKVPAEEIPNQVSRVEKAPPIETR